MIIGVSQPNGVHDPPDDNGRDDPLEPVDQLVRQQLGQCEVDNLGMCAGCFPSGAILLCFSIDNAVGEKKSNTAICSQKTTGISHLLLLLTSVATMTDMVTTPTKAKAK